MKIAAASLPSEDLHARIVAIIGHISGQGPERIVSEARLREDLGIHGDDGYELMTELDGQFIMDWTGFDLGVHFGMEGLGAPLPWQVKHGTAYYVPQPLTVGRLAGALRAGRWPGSSMIPRPIRQRVELHAASWIQFGLLVLSAAAFMCLLAWRMFGA
jgi:hypothetical protein